MTHGVLCVVRFCSLESSWSDPGGDAVRVSCSCDESSCDVSMDTSSPSMRSVSRSVVVVPRRSSLQLNLAYSDVSNNGELNPRVV